MLEDRGGASALPYYEALNLQPRRRTGAAVHPDAQLTCHTGGRAAMLPVRSAELARLAPSRRVIEAPASAVRGHRRRRGFPGLVERRAAGLRERGAVGLVVERRDRAGPGAGSRALPRARLAARPLPATTWPIAWACGACPAR